MAEKKKMSVAEILAAARTADGGEGGSGTRGEGAVAEPRSASGVSPEKSSLESAETVAESGQGVAEEKRAAKPAAAKASGARPSVAEMLALARGQAAGGSKTASKPSPTKPAPTKPVAAKPVAAKPAQEKAARGKGASAARATGPKSTASILVAVPQGHKPGPMSKAEAKARGGSAAVSPRPRPKRVAPPMPEKPAYARPKGSRSQSGQEGTSRRGFISGTIFGSFLAVGFVSLTATVGLWTLGLARFMFPNVLREPPSRFKVGFPADFAPGQVETKFKAQFGLWVVHWKYEGQPEIYALKSVCTHLGCTPNWLEGEQKFKCPCHGSGYYKDGVNFEGPAPRPLERYAIHIADDGQLEIDKSKTFHQELGQWADPASYVTA